MAFDTKLYIIVNLDAFQDYIVTNPNFFSAWNDKFLNRFDLSKGRYSIDGTMLILENELKTFSSFGQLVALDNIIKHETFLVDNGIFPYFEPIHQAFIALGYDKTILQYLEENSFIWDNNET